MTALLSHPCRRPNAALAPRCEATTRREAQGRDYEQFKNKAPVALERFLGSGRKLSRYPRHGRAEGGVPFQGRDSSEAG